MTARTPDALEACIAELDDVLVQLVGIYASLHRLRGDFELTESRLRYTMQGLQEARDDAGRAVKGWRPHG